MTTDPHHRSLPSLSNVQKLVRRLRQHPVPTSKITLTNLTSLFSTAQTKPSTYLTQRQSSAQTNPSAIPTLSQTQHTPTKTTIEAKLPQLHQHIVSILTTLDPHQLPYKELLWDTYARNAPKVNPRAHAFFPLLLLGPASLCTALTILRQERTYNAPSSLATALSTLLAPARWLQAWLLLQQAPPPVRPCFIHDQSVLLVWISFFKKEQNKRGPTWLPTDAGKVVTLHQAAILQRQMWADPLALAGWLAFVGGRRICDVLRIRIADLFGAATPTTPQTATTPLLGLAALLVDHKTAASQGSFAMHLPDTLIPLIQHTIQAARGSEFLFGSADWRLNERELKRRYLADTDLRGLRRGGLCQASLTAATEEDLLNLSDHTSVRALKTYMAGGLLAGVRRRKQITFMEATTQRIEEIMAMPNPAPNETAARSSAPSYLPEAHTVSDHANYTKNRMYL